MEWAKNSLGWFYQIACHIRLFRINILCLRNWLLISVIQNISAYQSPEIVRHLGFLSVFKPNPNTFMNMTNINILFILSMDLFKVSFLINNVNTRLIRFLIMSKKIKKFYIKYEQYIDICQIHCSNWKGCVFFLFQFSAAQSRANLAVCFFTQLSPWDKWRLSA